MIYDEDLSNPDNLIGLSIYRNNANQFAVRFNVEMSTTTVSSITPFESNPVYDNDWAHIVGTWNKTHQMVYINGLRDDIDANTNRFNVTMGIDTIGSGGAGTVASNATIDDMMVWNRSLLAAEVAALYANQTTKYLETNFTSLDYGNYTFKAYAQDRAGNVNSTETRLVNITSSIMAPIPETHIIRMILTLSNLNNYVYIPGIGEVASSAITNTSYTGPAHWYIASYLNNALNALVFVRESPNALMVNRTSSEHSIAISQALDGSKSMLAFTSGDWEAVDNRIESIESGGFMNAITPSFAHGLGVNYMIKILVNYADIDMVNELILSGGSQGIEFSNTGVSERKITLNVSAV